MMYTYNPYSSKYIYTYLYIHIHTEKDVVEAPFTIKTSPSILLGSVRENHFQHGVVLI